MGSCFPSAVVIKKLLSSSASSLCTILSPSPCCHFHLFYLMLSFLLQYGQLAWIVQGYTTNLLFWEDTVSFRMWMHYSYQYSIHRTCTISNTSQKLIVILIVSSVGFSIRIQLVLILNVIKISFLTIELLVQSANHCIHIIHFSSFTEDHLFNKW